jgi:hypothetical protein
VAGIEKETAEDRAFPSGCLGRNVGGLGRELMSHRIRGRKDHYLPQGYLRGFIDPTQVNEDKPLWWFQIPHGKWKRCSTAEVGFIRGFYDYSQQVDPSIQTADQAFAELERNFTLILKELLTANFSSWLDHREFLLRYMQMIRVRSPLYFEQKRAVAKITQAYVIEEISEDRKKLKVRPMQLLDPFIKNRSLTEMKEEMQKGADWLNEYDWALRYCDSPQDSFLTSDGPFVVTGPLEGQDQQVSWDALRHPDTLFYFPLCWQACIVGSPLQFDVKTDRAHPRFLQRVRDMYREKAKDYLISSIRL